MIDDTHRSHLAGCNLAGAIASLLGILGFILSFIPLVGIVIGYLLGLPAIVLGIVGLMSRGEKTLATVGLVLGLLTVAFKSIPLIRWL
jgi:hypothetical protein